MRDCDCTNAAWHGTRLRAGLAIFLLVLLCASATGQETHFQTAVTSADAQVDVDLSGLSSTAGSTITIRNNSGSTVAMPWISAAGTMPPLSKKSIVAFLQQSATDEAFAIATWQYVLNQTVAHCSAGSPHDPGGYASDPIRILYGYGVACCDQHAVLLAWLWDAAGYQTRVAMMTFHTVPEIYYGGAWHMLDPNHRVFYRDASNAIASVAEILADPSIVANTADVNGKDPVGWSAVTMAQLYLYNASSLRYVTGPWPEPPRAEFNLLPLESVQLQSENPSPDLIYHPIDPAETPLAASAFDSAVLRRWLPYSDSNWLSRAQASQAVTVTTGPDGRQALVTDGTNPGYVVYQESTPFPILSLQVSGEFFRSDPNATIVVSFSPDGTSWSDGVAVSLASVTGSSFNNINLSGLARGAYSYFVKIQFNGSTAGAVGAYELNIRSEMQMAAQMFPKLVAGQINRLEYRDLSPSTQARQVVVEIAIPCGKPELQGLSVESQVGESTTYSIARNYQARRLTDGDAWSLAYPGSSQIDYVIHLGASVQVSQVSIWWGAFGTNPIYVSNWNVYGRSATNQPWQLLSSGGFPDCAACDLTMNATVTDLRLVASGNNWIGAYEVKVYGDKLVPAQADGSRTVYSNVPEDVIYSLGRNYGGANLIDGNPATLAYPAGLKADYVIGLGGYSHVSNVAIRWGYFGSNPIYIANWTLYSRTGSGDWIIAASDGFPASDSTSVPLDLYATDLRLVAKSNSNWIGVYELGIAATKVLQPVSTSSNVNDSGPYAHPTSNLTDGNEQTLAYPGSAFLDYQLDFDRDTYLDLANIVWGYFGTDPIYVSNWIVYGQRDGDTVWVPIAWGDYPNASTTQASIKRTIRRLRLSASSAAGNWIGVYSLEPWGVTSPGSN